VSEEHLGFPVSAEDVTPAWLTDVLRSSGAIGVGHEVATVAVSRLGAGAGFMGSVARLTLTYSGEPGGVSSVVVKSAAPEPEMRELVRGYRNYEREVGFFRHVAGEFGDGVPRCYAAQIDGPSNHFVLVLEDLSAGFRDGDHQLPVRGLALDDERLARRHAERCLDDGLRVAAQFVRFEDLPGLHGRDAT